LGIGFLNLHKSDTLRSFYQVFKRVRAISDSLPDCENMLRLCCVFCPGGWQQIAHFSTWNPTGYARKVESSEPFDLFLFRCRGELREEVSNRSRP
jgi:hypothetical protein